MATVYLAHDPRFGRDVALKAIALGYKDEPTFRSRFEREARTIASLEHPAIVPVYDFGEDNDQLFLVMRYIPNGTLSDRIVMGPMSADRAIPIVRRIADALDHAHQRGVVHRDLKPGNILFDEYERAYLSDFGIVKLAAEETKTDLTGSGVIGTPSYMSPEQVHGDELVDGRSDIYTLGVILFEMLTARKPYRADTPVKQMMAHVMEPIPDISKILPELPVEFATVMARALAKAKEERYQTAHDLTADLTSSLTGGNYAPIPRPVPQIDPVDRDAETVMLDPDTVPNLEAPTFETEPPDEVNEPDERTLDAAPPDNSTRGGASPDEPTIVKPSRPQTASELEQPKASRRWPLVAVGGVLLLLLAFFGLRQLLPSEDTALPTATSDSAVVVVQPQGEDEVVETVVPVAETAVSAETPTVTPTPTLPTSEGEFQIGTSVNGQPLLARRFGDGGQRILLVGGIHSGRASSSVELMAMFIAEILERPELVPDNVTLLIVPNINPDAVDSDERSNANGVDLNRNWDCNWQPNPSIQGITMSGMGGERPFSEPETEALRDLILETAPQLVIFWDAPVTTGWVDPAGCTAVSRQAQQYGDAFVQETGYFFGETPPTQSGGVTGNAADWAVSQGFPALTIWLPSRVSADLDSNLDGLMAVMQLVGE